MGEAKEQQMAINAKQKDIAEEVAISMGLAIRFEENKNYNPPIFWVIFNGTDTEMGEFRKRFDGLDK